MSRKVAGILLILIGLVGGILTVITPGTNWLIFVPAALSLAVGAGLVWEASHGRR